MNYNIKHKKIIILDKVALNEAKQSEAKKTYFELVDKLDVKIAKIFNY